MSIKFLPLLSLSKLGPRFLSPYFSFRVIHVIITSRIFTTFLSQFANFKLLLHRKTDHLSFRFNLNGLLIVPKYRVHLTYCYLFQSSRPFVIAVHDVGICTA